MAITIKDIAKETGFSLATISFVLNDKKTGISISEATKTKVKEAAERLGYQPNYQAQALRRQKSNTIGVVFGTNYGSLNDPVVAEILSGVGAALDPTDYEMHLLASYEDLTRRSIQAARSRKVDGLIYFVYASTFEYFNSEIVPRLRKEGIPFFAIQFYSRFFDPHCVRVDVAAGTRKAVALLAETGCRSAGLVIDAGPGSIAGQEVEEAFRSAVAGMRETVIYNPKKDPGASGIPEHRHQLGVRLAEELAAGGKLMDGYFFFSDIIAAAFVETLRSRGIDVPGRVKVIGFGNIVNERVGTGELTTVDGCYFESGRKAGSGILDILEKGVGMSDGQKGIMLEPDLIIRKTA